MFRSETVLGTVFPTMIESDSSMNNPKPFTLALEHLYGYGFEYRDC